MSSRIAIAFIGLSLATATSAAAQTSIGQIPPFDNPEATCSGISDLWQTGLAGNTSYVVPRAGAITSWSTKAADGAGQALTFKVLRPKGSRYLVVGHDGPRQLAPRTVNTFRTAIPVQAGDILALNSTSGASAKTACTFSTSAGPDEVQGAGGNAPDGAELEAAAGVGFATARLNVQATLQDPPLLTSVAPLTGSVTGGSTVVLTGSNFAEVKSVAFGGAPAKSFSVDSETQITAIAPASSSLGEIPVSVTTIAGTATAPQKFSYEGCRVPKLKKLALKKAKKKLRRAGCKPGRVKTIRRVRSGTGPRVAVPVVRRQSAKPGVLLPIGAKVNMTAVVLRRG